MALPTAKALRESADPIAVYTSKNYSISVYPSGFALAKSYKRTTVVRIDECGDYDYDTAHKDLANRKKSATPSHIGMEVFLDSAWPVRVTILMDYRLVFRDIGLPLPTVYETVGRRRPNAFQYGYDSICSLFLLH